MAVTAATCKRAALLVDRSGLPAELEKALRTLRPDGSVETRGRPRSLSVRTLLIGIALCALDNRELHLVRVREILQNLTPSQVRTLGIAVAEAKALKVVSDRQVSYLWCRVISVFDPSPHFSAAAREALDARPDDPKNPKPIFDPERFDALQGVLDRILEASLFDSDLPGRRTGSYAVDWTYVESWAKRRKNTDPSPDPDAAHVFLRKEAKYSPKHNLYGYKLHAFIRTRTVGGDRVPYLAERITLTPATADPQTRVLDVVKDLKAEGRIKTLIADRGYTFAKPERWAVPLRELGVDTIFDLHRDQRGVKGTFQGALQIDGNLYCPAMPEALMDFERLDHFATVAQREEFFKLVEERQLYEMRAHGREKPGKNRRLRCPAAAGLVRCPLKPASMNASLEKPTVYPEPGLQASPPVCCSQQTISVPVEIQSATRQSRTWGTREWFDAYARLRPAVESFFGLIKDPGKEHMSRGRVKMMGIAKTSVMVAFWAAAANLRLLAAFNRDEKRRAEAAEDGEVAKATRQPRRHRALPLITQRTTTGPPTEKTPAAI